MKIIFTLILASMLSGCATKHGVAVYGWKSNISISVAGDSTQEAMVEATTDTKANAMP
jgi:hypothetical protein